MFNVNPVYFILNSTSSRVISEKAATIATYVNDDIDKLLIGEGDKVSFGDGCQLLVNEQYSDVKNNQTHRLTEDENMEIGGVCLYN